MCWQTKNKTCLVYVLDNALCVRQCSKVYVLSFNFELAAEKSS